MRRSRGKGNAMQAKTIASWAGLLKAIAHPTRLMILAELAEAEKCVNDIRDLLSIRQPNVSQHLAVLKDSGLVASRKDGARRCYHLMNPGLIRGVLAVLSRYHPSPQGVDAGAAPVATRSR